MLIGKLLSLPVIVYAFGAPMLDQSTVTPSPVHSPIQSRRQVQPRFDTPSQVSPQVDGLRFALVARRDGYKYKKPVEIIFYTISTLRHDVNINLDANVAYELVRSGFGTIHAHRRDDSVELRTVSNHEVPIVAGKSMGIGDNIAELYDIVPGTYSIRARITLPLDGAVLVSPWTSFNVASNP